METAPDPSTGAAQLPGVPLEFPEGSSAERSVSLLLTNVYGALDAVVMNARRVLSIYFVPGAARTGAFHRCRVREGATAVSASWLEKWRRREVKQLVPSHVALAVCRDRTGV